MLYIVLFVFCFSLLAAALFYFFKSNELSVQLRESSKIWREREDAYTSELDKLEKLRHIPDVIEKARKTKEQAEASLGVAQMRADEILTRALAEAEDNVRGMREDAERQRAAAQEELKVARWQAQNTLAEAQAEAKELASRARREAKEKVEKAKTELNMASA
jgi:hypothetical protein